MGRARPRRASEPPHGAWAIDPERGGRKFISEHCHTEGARELAAAGVPMLSSAGNAIFEFGDGAG